MLSNMTLVQQANEVIFLHSNFVDRIERIMTVCPLTIVIFHDFSIFSVTFFLSIYLFFDYDIYKNVPKI